VAVLSNVGRSILNRIAKLLEQARQCVELGEWEKGGVLLRSAISQTESASGLGWFEPRFLMSVYLISPENSLGQDPDQAIELLNKLRGKCPLAQSRFSEVDILTLLIDAYTMKKTESPGQNFKKALEFAEMKEELLDSAPRAIDRSWVVDKLVLAGLYWRQTPSNRLLVSKALKTYEEIVSSAEPSIHYEGWTTAVDAIAEIKLDRDIQGKKADKK